MNPLQPTKRKNFKCVFNQYVTKDNQDAVVRSIISQFEGYYANPEVTVHDGSFTISLDMGDNLSPTTVRDKILWNQFVESVTTADAIRKIQIIRLPKAGIMDFGARTDGKGSVGGFGPEVDPIVGDTGVNEKLNTPLTVKPRKYQIDADPGDSLGHHASVHYADPTDTMSEDQTYVPGLTPEGLDSESTEVSNDDETTELDSGQSDTSLPNPLGSFRRIAIDSDTGGAFTLNKPRGFQSVNDTPATGGLHQKATPATGIGGGAPISGASWYVTQPGNEQQTDLGTERVRDDAKSAPLSFAAGKILPEEAVEDKDSAVEIPQARGGGQSVPDGGQVEGWFASRLFGINETYDYEGDIDGYDI